MKIVVYTTLFFFSLLSTAAIFFFYQPIGVVPFPLLFAGELLVFFIYILFYQSISSIVYNRQVTILFIMAAILAILFLLSTVGPRVYLNDNSLLEVSLVNIGSFLMVGVGFSLLFLKWKGSESAMVAPATNWDFLLYFSFPFFTGLGYLFAFYPGVMTNDSFQTWEQIHTFKFNDWHPVVFSWTVLLTTLIKHSPASFSLFQNLILALIIAYSFWQLQKLGVRKIIIMGMCFIIILIPPYGIYMIAMWKDILYSGCLLLFTVHLFLIMYSNGVWLNRKANKVFFFLSSFGVAFYRHNGYMVFLLTMIVLLIIYWRKLWKPAGATLFIILLLHQMLVGPIFHFLHVKPSKPNEALAIPTQQIGYIIIKNGNLTDEQREYFNQILPIDLWKKKYSVFTVNHIKFADEYNPDVIFDDFPKYLKIWAQVVRQNPSLAMESFLKQTELVWKLGIPIPWRSLTYATVIIDNQFGLKQRPTYLTKPTLNYLQSTLQSPFWFLWRPALYAFVVTLFLQLYGLNMGGNRLLSFYRFFSICSRSRLPYLPKIFVIYSAVFLLVLLCH